MRDATWIMVSAAEVPAGDEWLGVRELAALAAFRFARRRLDWRAGRWAAKQAVLLAGAARLDQELSNFEILSAGDGCPELWIGGRRAGVNLSISHRDGAATALVCGGQTLAGCDLELIEARPQSFAEDWFTANELAVISESSPAARDRTVTMIWSAKESALKAIRLGLRADTREVEISPGPRRFVASIHGRDLPGLWRVSGSWLMTAVLAGATPHVEERMRC
ncbi:MAG TPA: 4'-phosphopantetheinyl transferase superfamily protein [Candidatus Udaeobacter sp.]|nr:4'-phosphopantetheinyl transferase superfamily protein [Candidatus Udaeobacter sp.]